MDGQTLTILGGFITTWIQIMVLYYKIGKLEAKIKYVLDSNNKKTSRVIPMAG